MYSKCEFRLWGIRCQNPGTMSRGLKEDAKWYCNKHFFDKED